MYINGEFVPVPLVVILALMVLTIPLVKWGERAQHQNIAPRRKLAIQCAALAPLGVACALAVAFVLANRLQS